MKNVANGLKLVIQPKVTNFIAYGTKLGGWLSNVTYGIKLDVWLKNAAYIWYKTIRMTKYEKYIVQFAVNKNIAYGINLEGWQFLSYGMKLGSWQKL